MLSAARLVLQPQSCVRHGTPPERPLASAAHAAGRCQDSGSHCGLPSARLVRWHASYQRPAERHPVPARADLSRAGAAPPADEQQGRCPQAAVHNPVARHAQKTRRRSSKAWVNILAWVLCTVPASCVSAHRTRRASGHAALPCPSCAACAATSANPAAAAARWQLPSWLSLAQSHAQRRYERASASSRAAAPRVAEAAACASTSPNNCYWKFGGK